MNSLQRCPLHCIVPPHMFKKMLESDDAEVRRSALETLIADTRTRGMREALPPMRSLAATTSGRRSIFDARNSHFLGNAVLRRSEGDDEVDDESVNRLYDALGTTRDFLTDVLDRDSIDDQGHPLEGYVHVGVNYNNATFDGRVMRFGDGDGVRFTDFTRSLDVIAHELVHGVTQYTSNFVYERQPGALNESMSDVFGSLVKQWASDPPQTVDAADWKIGAEVFTPGIGMDSLRSMSNPGQAYDNPLFGRDPQPDHMDNYFPGPEDNFGVHINSGIPNKAFYLVATKLGGYAWEVAGHIWYAALLSSNPTSQFQDFADQTYLMASEQCADAKSAVSESWREVGIRITGVPGGGRGRARRKLAEATMNDGTLATLTKQIEVLAGRVKTLSKDVKSLKK